MQSLIDFLSAFLNAILFGLSGITGFFVSFFFRLGDLLFDSSAFFFGTLYDDMRGFIFEVILDCIGSAFGQGSTEFVGEVYSTIAFFVPLNFLFSAIFGVLSVWVTVFTCKVLLKIIPTVY